MSRTDRLIGPTFKVLARTEFQPVWRRLFDLSIRGLGFMNADPRFNGEDRWLGAWSGQCGSRQSPVVIDVGANEGDFIESILAVRPGATIHAFEPNPQTFDRLSRRFAPPSRSNVFVNRMALGEACEVRDLFDHDSLNGTGHASLLRETFDSIHPSPTHSVAVDVTTLDQYLDQHQIDFVDLLKIDVEGMEGAVLKGAAAAIANRRIAAIQLEFNAHAILTGFSLLELGRVLDGYLIYRVLPNGLSPLIGDGRPYNSRHEIFKYSNVVALQKSIASSFR